MRNIDKIIESQYPPRRTNVAWKDLNENTLKFYVDGEWRALKDEDFRQKQADWNQVDNTKADFIKNKPAVILQIAPMTYAELKELRDSSQLTPGMHYRITDYTCTTTQENTQSAGHQFDIIVMALDESTLSEEASAILHDGDTYFADCNLNAWQVWYCLDNDTDRFAWASVPQNSPFSNQPIISVRGHDNGTYIYVRYPSLDTGDTYAWAYSEACDDVSISEWIQTCIDSESERLDTSDIIYTATAAPEIGDELDMGGTTVTVVERSRDEGAGVIYRMIDEWNNDCPYDFKNIQFKRKLSNGEYDPDNGTDAWVYTFNAWCESDGLMYDGSKIANLFPINDYTCICEYNVIKHHKTMYDGRTYRFLLNDIVFLNTFDFPEGAEYYFECHSNTFGSTCYSNTFGSGCYSNTFSNSCHHNTFGTSCDSNTFGIDCYSNTFGNYCSSITFGGNCHYNTFGDICFSNTFDDPTDVSYVSVFPGINNKVISVETNVDYRQFVGIDSSYVLKVWVPADSAS